MGFLAGNDFNGIGKNGGFPGIGACRGDNQGMGSRGQVHIGKVNRRPAIAIVIGSQHSFVNIINLNIDILIISILKFQCPQISFILFSLCV